MADVDYSKLTDAELEAIYLGSDVTKAPPGKGLEVAREHSKALAEKMARITPKTKAEEIEPSAVSRGLAAVGGALQEPVLGAVEKFQLAFPGATPEAAEATRKRIGEERTERREIQKGLEETTAGQFGGFVGKVAPFALAPQTAAAQATLAGTLGFLGGGPDQPTGLGQELGVSARTGAVDAAATAAAVKGIQAAGKGINAARGRFTPEGQKAMELDRAARSLGLPAPTIGQLDPFAPEAIRARPELAAQQAKALQTRMEQTRQVPSPAGGMEAQIVPGGKLQAGLEEAINVRKGQARDMYQNVDDYVAFNNLGNVPATNTVNALASANKLTARGKQPTGNNIVFNLLDNYDPDAFMWLKQSGSAKAAKQAGMTMTQYHDARVAVGRALNSLERKNPADLTADQIDAKRMLVNLKTSLDNDVGQWATANKGNEEAIGLYNRAKDFYATTVAEAVNTPFARKVTSKSRGFASPEQMYAAVVNPANRSLVERLLPTASPETRDILNVMQNLPDVGQAVAKGKVPAGAAEAELGALVRAGLGHPMLAATELAPGLRWLSTKTPAKALYFAQTPTGRYVGPSAQYPAGGLETWAQGILSPGQNR